MLNVEKFLHEVGLGVKGQSNLVIAGSPRNSFRASLEVEIAGGRALIRRGAYPATKPSQTTNGCNYTRESDYDL